MGFQIASTLLEARKAIEDALTVDWVGGLELVAMELREAIDAVGGLSTPLDEEELLQKIFSQFCIGK